MEQRRNPRRRVELGDWQTPGELAREVVRTVAGRGVRPETVIEPTCGKGGLLVAARDRWRSAALVGYEVDPGHVQAARSALPPPCEVRKADFFALDWEAELGRRREPLLVIGNPPWVTSAELGALGSRNLPEKRSFDGLSGLDALTGRSNFDVSEWMLLRLLHALDGRRFVLAFLCKLSVARRIMEHTARARWNVEGELRAIDARECFGAAVDAVLLTVSSLDSSRPVGRGDLRWPAYASLSADAPSAVIGYVDGVSTPDVDACERTRHLAGRCDPEWRSGLKHDCSAVMEFAVDGGRLRSRAGEVVDLEPDFVFPMMKGSDVVHGRWPPARAVLVPQRSLGQQTDRIEALAPRTWRYLDEHRAALAARRSSVYARRPAFAVFGVGEYTFAPWKVAVAGLYKRLVFTLIGPQGGRPVVLDDTTYFLPFTTEAEARSAHEALTSPAAAEFFNARIFWDDKRPINKRVLQSLDLRTLEKKVR